jgi:hypothetical protein
LSTFVLTDVSLLVGGLDVTCASNSASLTPSVDVQDATTFCSQGWRQKASGLRDIEAEVSGFYDGTVDAATFSALGSVSGDVVTMVPQSTAGNVSYFFQGGRFEYEAFGGIGDLTPFTLSMQGTGGYGLIRGALAAPRGTSVSATGTVGSPVNLGAGGAGKYAYVAVHVLTAGTTLSLQLQQSTTQGGTYSSITTPSTTVGPLTTTGSTLFRVSAATGFTGPWYRLNASAATGTFAIAASIAIQ